MVPTDIDDRYELLRSHGWVEIREIGAPGAWVATDAPVPIEE